MISPAIDYGAVAVDGSAIVAVDTLTEVTKSFPHAAHEDFGNAAILPGFVNTHSHLELTVMRGFLEREEHDFFAWLKKLTVARLQMTDEDLFVSAACGAIEATRAGITCLGDSSSFALPAVRGLQEVGLRGIVYQESFGPDPSLAADNMVKLRAQIDAVRSLETNLIRAGVSPHAPYTVSAAQLEMISRMAIDEKLPVMMHAAESQAEKHLLMDGTGPFAEGLKARAIPWSAPGVSAVKYLSDHGVLDTRPLLAHCINVDDEDLDQIKKARAGIAHCPKSNAKLGHGRAPFAKFLAHEINVGFGSDSVASNNLCDILEEARFATLMARIAGDIQHPAPPRRSIDAHEALFAATLGGARAMGLDDQVGALRAGMQADLAIVSLEGQHQQPAHDPQDTLIFSSSGRDVVLTVVAGREIYRNGRVMSTDEANLQNRLNQLGVKICQD